MGVRLDQPRFINNLTELGIFTKFSSADEMFGALNRFIGRLDGEPTQQPRNGPNDNAFGFQVLRNKDAELPLEPWFDFIVGINGHPIVWLCFCLSRILVTLLISICRRTRTQTSLRRKSATAPGQV